MDHEEYTMSSRFDQYKKQMKKLKKNYIEEKRKLQNSYYEETKEHLERCIEKWDSKKNNIMKYLIKQEQEKEKELDKKEKELEQKKKELQDKENEYKLKEVELEELRCIKNVINKEHDLLDMNKIMPFLFCKSELDNKRKTSLYPVYDGSEIQEKERDNDYDNDDDDEGDQSYRCEEEDEEEDSDSSNALFNRKRKREY